MNLEKKVLAITVLVFVVGGLTATSGAQAQDHYTATVTVQGGMGGAVGEDEGDLGNQSLQLGFSLLQEDLVHVGLKIATIDFAAGDSLGGRIDNTLNYLTLTGEYRFLENFYESGLFAGVGFYQLEGIDVFGVSDSEQSVGIVLGVSGEFEINRRLGFAVELAGHLANLDGADIFATAHAGLAVHF